MKDLFADYKPSAVKNKIFSHRFQLREIAGKLSQI